VSAWPEVTAAAPDLAERVRGRFNATGLGFLATLRSDGSPRIHGIEPLFGAELWIGMMPDSRKAFDLRRDPRFALHSASVDKDVKEGDAKLDGRAVEVAVDDGEARAQFWADWSQATGNPTPDEPWPMVLFRVDVRLVSFLRPAGDHLVIEWWTAQGGYTRIERR
jgi:hypothetical protein